MHNMYKMQNVCQTTIFNEISFCYSSYFFRNLRKHLCLVKNDTVIICKCSSMKMRTMIWKLSFPINHIATAGSVIIIATRYQRLNKVLMQHPPTRPPNTGPSCHSLPPSSRERISGQQTTEMAATPMSQKKRKTLHKR